MTKEEAIRYCHQHRDAYVAELITAGEDGVEQFECLVGCIAYGSIKPEELEDYGMDY